MRNPIHPTEVYGHRGDRGHFPENTLPSFASAIEKGADALELDLLATSDGAIVIHHDYAINPKLCTRLDGSPLGAAPSIHSLTLQEIKQFDCGGKKNPVFPKQISLPRTEIPTLQELFDLVRSHPQAQKLQLDLEIKIDPSSPLSAHAFAKKIVAEVEKNGFSERVYYSSFDPEVLSQVRKNDKGAKILFLYSSQNEAKKIAENLEARTLGPKESLLSTKEDLFSLQKGGFQVIAWTVNDPNRWKELIDWGVDGIITDYPGELIERLLLARNCRFG